MPGIPFSSALEALQAQCPEVEGAVLATPEGLVLAASGALTTDAAAASCAHAADQIDRCLSLLAQDGCSELLIWTDASLSCLLRLAGRFTLLVTAGPECQAGALRLAARHTAALLSPRLQSLHEQARAAGSAAG